MSHILSYLSKLDFPKVLPNMFHIKPNLQCILSLNYHSLFSDMSKPLTRAVNGF